ncbi:MAG: SGNH/GDSL hydrolase family protein [Lachnospiraceae bacterium]|nr:SGNH/GDSL hydrolase family protein [Lachnospiraceae bacterium]
MNKFIMRTTAMTLAVSMVFTMANLKPVSAKTVKLAKTSVTVTVGKTKAVKIKNISAKSIKSMKVTSANKKYVTVKKNSNTKFTIKGVKAGSTKVKITLKYKKGKKTVTKKMTLKVKVNKKTTTSKTTTAKPADTIPADTKRVDDSKAYAVMKATEAVLKAGSEPGGKRTPELDKDRKLITAMVTNASATYTVPAGISGVYDIYLEIGHANYVAGESMYSININNDKHYCLPAAILTGAKYQMGRFVMAYEVELKAGDKISVVGNIGFSKVLPNGGMSSDLPPIGNLSLYKAGTPVAIGYNGGVVKDETTDETDPVSGKKIAWLGSSVTYGYGSGGYSMADEISRLHKNTTCYKYAISGTTLVNETGTSYVARMMNDMNPNEKFDMIIVQLSTNDASTNKALGSVGESFDINSFDDKTICGAIETILAYVKETWNCPVVFYTGTKYDNANYANMVQALYSISSKWNIDIIDLWGDDDMSSVRGTSLYNTYMKDPIHPTKDGYVKWWTPKFDEYLKNNFKPNK